MIQTQQQNLGTGVPETVRGRVLKGFRGRVDGKFDVVNPGDIVDVDRALAFEMRGMNRFVMVAPDTPLSRVKNYLPERKRNAPPPGVDPVAAQLAALAKSQEAQAKAIDALTKAVAALAPAAKA